MIRWAAAVLCGIQIFATPETVMKREQKRSAGSWIRKNAEVEKTRLVEQLAQTGQLGGGGGGGGGGGHYK